MKKILISIFLLTVTASYSQELNVPVATQYLADNPYVISPSYAGIGDNFRINKPLTSRIAYSAIIDVITMGVAQLKPEAQEHLYNIVDSQRSLKVKN